MSKLESTIVGVLIGGACVWLSFVACWWTAAIIHIYVGGTSASTIAGAALVGLLIGIVLDILFLRRWVRGFYTARKWLLATLYCALCVLAVASFMGLPVGTFGLGLLAGAYAGRRYVYKAAGDSAEHELRRTAVFAALMTSGAALPIGLLALQDRPTAELFSGMLGIRSWGAGVAVVCVLCVLLFGVQYWCSLCAGRLALRLGSGTIQCASLHG